jgi:polyisoprenoid-binding protein YceI
MAHGRLIVAAFLVVAQGGCDWTAKGAAPSASAAVARAPVRFVVQPFGAAVIVVNGEGHPKPSDVKGLVQSFGGELEIDLEDLTRSRGMVTIDLAGLETHSLGDDALDADITGRVRDWLEVGKEPLRFARFTLRAVDRASEQNALEAAGDKRAVTLFVTGDLTLHGVKVEKKMELAASFAMADGVVSRVTLRTAQPVAVSLSEHGVRPRGPDGVEIADSALGAAGAGHVDAASVTFEISARR